MDKIKITKEKIEKGIVLLGVSIFMLLGFSNTTSPIYDCQGYDSAIFRMLGRLTRKGMVPYKEFFDHKGPIIVLIEYIGALISNDKWGIFIAQIPFMFFSIYGIYKIVRLWCDNKASIIMTLIGMMSINMYLEGGNLTEEYCLPFLIWSTYFAIRYLKKELPQNKEHSVKYSILYAISFMVCALTRISNAMVLCVIILVGIIAMVINGQWKGILKNIIGFIVTCILFFIPFLIYFVKEHALYDMIYATFIYNFRYVVNDSTTVTIKEKILFLRYLTPLFAAIVAGMTNIYINQKKNYISWIAVIGGLIGIIVQLEGRLYLHYLLVYIPIIVITLGIFYDNVTRKDNKVMYIAYIPLIALMVIVIKNVLLVGDATRIYDDKMTTSFEKSANDIVNLIPKEDEDKLIAYNVQANFYLATDMQPCYKYCILQDWQCSMDKEMDQEFTNDLRSLKAKYIVANNYCENKKDEIIKQFYTEIDSNDFFILYKRK